MPAIKSIGKVNLLPLDSFEASVWGRGLKWALTAGRILVVLTEFVVILAFASRFWFDKRLNDLVEVIDQKKQVVASYVEVENEMRDILARQEPVETATNRKVTSIGLLEKLSQTIPQETTLTDLSIEEDKITLAGTSVSENGMARSISTIMEFPEIQDLNLEEITFDQKQAKVVFKVTGSLQTYDK